MNVAPHARPDRRRGVVVGVGAGLAWLGASAFLGFFSAFAMFLLPWSLAALAIGLRLLRARPEGALHALSAGAAACSAIAAAWFALALPGSEAMWIVVILSGVAGIYSVVARLRARVGGWAGL